MALAILNRASERDTPGKPCSADGAGGFTLIELLVTLAILMLVMVGIIDMAQVGFHAATEAQARIMASALANERVETVRNLPYESIGTLNGVPPGTIPQSETRTINGIDYTIKTAIIYVDDPFDGTAPGDTLPTDYKSVRVEVDWTTPNGASEPVLLYTKATPKGEETASSGGTLSILVFNATASPVSGASVHIVGQGLSPAVDITQNTNSNGRLSLPGMPACDSCYRVTVTKSGYSTDRTYSSSQVSTPLEPDLSVLEGKVTEASFSIDQTATLTIHMQKPAPPPGPPDPPVAANAIPFKVEGAKLIGHDSGNNPVLKYSNAFTTDDTGTTIINSLEWDSYTISIDNAAVGYDIAQTTPFMPPTTVQPAASVTQNILLEPHAANTLRVYVTNSNNAPLSGAAVELADGGTYDTTLTTDGSGQVFFTPLSAESYTITVTLTGYDPYTDAINVSGNMLKVTTLNVTSP